MAVRHTKSTPSLPLSAAQTRAWLATYTRHSRLYVRIFFVLVSGLILGLIWWELGEINQELLCSFAFAVLVFFWLARWSGKQTNQSWSGTITEKFIKKTRRNNKQGSTTVTYHPRAIVRTTTGKKIRLLLPETLYNYFQAGEELFKISGLEWPEKTKPDKVTRVCLACGKLYPCNAGGCPRCGAPEPDHDTLRHLARAK